MGVGSFIRLTIYPSLCQQIAFKILSLGLSDKISFIQMVEIYQSEIYENSNITFGNKCLKCLERYSCHLMFDEVGFFPLLLDLYCKER